MANLKEDYKDVEAKVKRFQDEMTSIGDALDPLIPERVATENLSKCSKAKVVELDAKIHDVHDEIYAEFSKRVGVKNIREHEEERETRRKKQAEAKAEFASQRARLVELLDYEKSRDNDAAIKAPRERHPKVREGNRSIGNRVGKDQSKHGREENAVERAGRRVETRER